MAKYNGSIELISGIKQANNETFPLVDASAVQVDDTGKRLNEALEELHNKESGTTTYPIVETSDTTIVPDQYNVFGVVRELSITLQDAKDDGFVHEYCFEFTTADEFYGLAITPEPKWVGESAIEANKTYQVSIVRGIGVIAGA